MYLFVLLGLILFTPHVESCTRILCNNDSSHIRVARSLDLYLDDQPQVLVCPKGISKNGQTGENAKRWKSKYGSVVVTAFHRNFVIEGINEVGFGAHLLFQEIGEFQEKNQAKPTLSNFCLAQYLLDNCKTVNDALQQLTLCQVVGTKLAQKEWPMQIAIEDLTGDSAVLEFVDGKINVHQGPQYKVVASSQFYEQQLEGVKEYKTFGGKLPIPGELDPQSRFVRACSFLRNLPTAEKVTDALTSMLSLIRSAQVPLGTKEVWETRWITVSDLSNQVLYFTSAVEPNTLFVDLKLFNLEEGSPITELAYAHSLPQ